MFMRLRLIYLHQYFTFPNETGGTRSYDLARSFVNKGINICIISATSDPKYDNDKRWNVIERDGLVVHYIYLPYGNHLSYCGILHSGYLKRMPTLSLLHQPH